MDSFSAVLIVKGQTDGVVHVFVVLSCFGGSKSRVAGLDQCPVNWSTCSWRTQISRYSVTYPFSDACTSDLNGLCGTWVSLHGDQGCLGTSPSSGSSHCGCSIVGEAASCLQLLLFSGPYNSQVLQLCSAAYCAVFCGCKELENWQLGKCWLLVKW